MGLAKLSFAPIADMIVEVVDGLAANGADGNGAVEMGRQSQGGGAVRPASLSTKHSDLSGLRGPGRYWPGAYKK